MIGGFWAPGSINCFSSLCCGKVAFKSHIYVLLLKLLFSLSAAGDLSPTWGPQALLPFWISGGCPWQVGRLVPLLHILFGEGGNPQCVSQLSTWFLICSFARADVWSLVFKSWHWGEGCFLPRLRLSRHPSPCGYFAQFMLSPGQAAGLGCLALLDFPKTSTLTKMMVRPRSFFSLFAGRGKGCSPWLERVVRTVRAGYHALMVRSKLATSVYRHFHGKRLGADRFLNLAPFCVDLRCGQSPGDASKRSPGESCVQPCELCSRTKMFVLTVSRSCRKALVYPVSCNSQGEWFHVNGVFYYWPIYSLVIMPLIPFDFLVTRGRHVYWTEETTKERKMISLSSDKTSSLWRMNMSVVEYLLWVLSFDTKLRLLYLCNSAFFFKKKTQYHKYFLQY